MRDFWMCPSCGEEMVRAFSDSNYLVCPKGHGRLRPAPTVEDLPLASRAVCRQDVLYPWTRLFRIDGKDGLWKYVSHAHKTALDKRPAPGTVVACVAAGYGRIRARVFRRAYKRLASELGV